MELKGKVAIVTGGGQGIGKAIAAKLAGNGANIVIADINLEQATTTAEELKALGVETLAQKVDVASLDSVKVVTQETMTRFGRIDILVNNAGITRDTLLLRMKPEDWDLVMSVNLKGAFNFTVATTPIMLKQKAGRIINIASVIGLMGNVGQANYAASKAGLIGLTKTTAKEVASRGITANAIAPGFIETAMTAKLPEAVREEMLKSIPMRNYGTPNDVAEAVAFLASDRARYITAHVLTVDGGMTAY